MNIRSQGNYNRLKTWLLRRTALSAIRRIAPLSACLSSDIGLVRKENQDRVVISRAYGSDGNLRILMVLSDGMGGMTDGAICSASTIAVVLESFFDFCKHPSSSEEWLISAANSANDEVYRQFTSSGGATLSALLLGPDGIHWLNVGDSRVYQYKENRLLQISVDDTIAGQLRRKVDNDNFSDSKLLQFIGMGKNLEPHIAKIPFELGSSLLITSDGIHYLESEIMERIITNSSDISIAIRRLSDLARWFGGSDNASISIITLSPTLGVPDVVDHSLLEVWDSFGELQIFMDIQDSFKPNDSDKFLSDVGRSGYSNSNQHTEVIVADSPKPKRRGGAKKTKAQKNRTIEVQVENEDDKEKSQLHIEFPNKEV
ncbi:TPA: PP2C family serine/threonine-protein phosphatase [Yersinia enterocolitica]